MTRWWWVVAIAACNGGKGTTGDTSGGGDATFSQVRDQVLTPSCALGGCHAVGDMNGFTLPSGGEYAAIVGVESTFAPGRILVVGGSADDSYLVAKMEDAVGITGSAMPPPFGGLDPQLLALVRSWIDAGAAND